MTKPTGRPRKKPAKKAADGVKRTATDRGRAFVAAYLSNGFNATQAAIAAGYSPKAATQTGSDLLRRPDVVELLTKERKRLEDENRVTADRVVAGLAAIAFADPRDLMSWGPGGVVLKPSEELTPAQAAQVESVGEVVTIAGSNIKVKRHDRVRALELLGKTLGLFVDRVDQKNTFLDADGKPTLPTVRVVFVNPPTGTEPNEPGNPSAPALIPA